MGQALRLGGPALLLGCLLAGMAELCGCSTTAFAVANVPAWFDRVVRHPDIAYGTDDRQRLDVYAPPHAAGLPVVIFWYGGTWVEGSKSEYRFVGTTLAERGFVAVLPDYRLYPDVTFPLFDVDAVHALAWVEHHIGAYGGDPHRIVLMGHSAGGHTAAFLAYDHAFVERNGADPRDIRGLVGLSGAYVEEPDTESERAAFPPPYTEKDWQPVRFVDALAPPTLLLHGLDDTDVYPREAIELRDALVKAHVRVDLHLYPHRDHGDTVAAFAVAARLRDPFVQTAVDFIRSVTEKGPAAVGGSGGQTITGGGQGAGGNGPNAAGDGRPPPEARSPSSPP